MLTFEKEPTTGQIMLVTDDAQAEMANLDDAGLGLALDGFDAATRGDDGMFRVLLPEDPDMLDDIEECVDEVDGQAGDALRKLRST